MAQSETAGAEGAKVSAGLPDWYIVRHAMSQPAGQTPTHRWPLTDAGWRQAFELPLQLARAGIAQQIDRIITSPYVRARDTVMPLAQTHSTNMTSCLDLRERDVRGGAPLPRRVLGILERGLRNRPPCRLEAWKPEAKPIR